MVRTHKTYRNHLEDLHQEEQFLQREISNPAIVEAHRLQFTGEHLDKAALERVARGQGVPDELNHRRKCAFCRKEIFLMFNTF